MPMVSTIIPAYNAAAYIEQAVESALNQRGVANEVIVVDDGSTDETWHRLERFGAAIRKVKQKNGGPARARNHGARLASGEWLAFLDADDQWLPEKTQTQLALADAHTGLVYADRMNVGSADRVNERQSSLQHLWQGDVFHALLMGNFVTLSTVLIRKDHFEELGGFPEDQELVGVEDWDLWLRYSTTRRLAASPSPLVLYRWHTTSLSHNFDHLTQARLRVLRRALALPRGQAVPRYLARHAFAQAWECSAWYAAPTRRWLALRCYLRAARYRPLNLRAYKGIVKCCLGLG